MPYTHHISPDPYPVGAVLTSSDPEPCGGHAVRDDSGQIWGRLGDYEHGSNWYMYPDGADYETWTKVAGNYGPVTVIDSADADYVEQARSVIDAHG